MQGLPAWLAQLLQPADSNGAEQARVPSTQPATLRLALPSLMAASDESVLATVLVTRPKGAPWLLHPLVGAPTLVGGTSGAGPCSEPQCLLCVLVSRLAM